MTALVSNVAVSPFPFPALTVPLGPIAEFLITELALASHSIPSVTLSSPSLLSPVLESHFPSAIIVEGSLLPHTLELIYELYEFERHSVVIVVGEMDENVLSNTSGQIEVARWADIEAQGKAAPVIISPVPGNHHSFQQG
jgi:long-chain acyl-CoA synthetase